MNKNNFFISMLSDESNSISSKRVVGIFCVLVLCTVLIISCFVTGITPYPELISAIEIIAICSLGFTSVDKFSAKKIITDNNAGPTDTQDIK